MVEGNFTLTPDMIWDGKKRRLTDEEVVKSLAFSKHFSERMRELDEVEPLPEDFIEYVKGRK
jgi:hypothetical protein